MGAQMLTFPLQFHMWLAMSFFDHHNHHVIGWVSFIDQSECLVCSLFFYSILLTFASFFLADCRDVFQLQDISNKLFISSVDFTVKDILSDPLDVQQFLQNLSIPPAVAEELLNTTINIKEVLTWTLTSSNGELSFVFYCQKTYPAFKKINENDNNKI